MKDYSKDKVIDLRSDTFSQPCINMRNAIYAAKVGDAEYGEDQSTLDLENYCATLFNKEAALFVPSGTMCNQIAIRSFTQPGDEVILDNSYHINYFEAGPTVDLGKVHLNLCNTKDGVLRVEDVIVALKNKHRSNLSAHPSLICLENTINTHSGKIYPLDELKRIHRFAKSNNLNIHMDGARLLNACVAKNISPSEYSSYVDSITVSFSKGLGAPFGSILMGTKSLIEKATKYRKWYGGGLRQSGFMAAAALYAIKNNIHQLGIDNENAKIFACLLSKCGFFDVDPFQIETNIVMINIRNLGITASKFIELARMVNVLLYQWSEDCVRAVTHLNVDKNDVTVAAKRLREIFPIKT